MDFRQTQPTGNRPATVNSAPVAPSNNKDFKPGKDAHKRHGSGKWLSFLNVVVLFGATILIAAIAVAFTQSNNDNEFKYVDQSNYQAVFLNNGQVYFGKVGTINGKYVELSDVYYLTQSSTSTDTSSTAAPSYNLFQLGCQQIHYPYDQMLINHDQVTFWENLNDKGQVVTRINQLKKQGVDCTKVSSQTQATSNSSAQGSTSTSTSTTPSTTTTTK